VLTLLVNSRDDPICVWDNVEYSMQGIFSNPNPAHADLYCGTHGCKFGFLAFSSHMEAMVGEFVLGSWHEWHRKRQAAAAAAAALAEKVSLMSQTQTMEMRFSESSVMAWDPLCVDPIRTGGADDNDDDFC